MFKIFWPWCLSSSTFCSILQVRSRQRRLINMNTEGKCWWYFSPLRISVQWNLHCFQGPRNWPNLFLQGSFLYNYFTITGEKKSFFIPRTSFYRGSPSSFHLPCEQTPLDQGRLMVLYSQRYHIVTSDNAESPYEHSIITLIFFVLQLNPIWTKFYKFCSPTHNNIIIIKQGK